MNIYSGNDDQILPVLSLGGLGVISVASNVIPKYMANIVNNYFLKEIKEAENMQIQVETLVELLFKEVNPIPVKELLNILGFQVGKPRKPLIKCSEELKKCLENEINTFVNKKWNKI